MPTLHIKKHHKTFLVDDPKIPGSPPIGRGRTVKEAVGDWFIGNQAKLGYDFDVTAIQKTEEARRRRALASR